MRPRPRSRNRPVEYVPPEVLLEEIKAIRDDAGEPEAIIMGRREWALIRAQPGAKPHLYCFPGDPDRLDGVMVFTGLQWTRPRILATVEEYEQAMIDRKR